MKLKRLTVQSYRQFRLSSSTNLVLLLSQIILFASAACVIASGTRWAIVATLLAAGAIAQGQQPKKVVRIGYLSAVDAASESARSEAIRLALRERGYIEGQNIATEYRYAEGKRNRFPELAAELVRLKVDIIVVAGGSAVIRAAKNATKTIPIVMTGWWGRSCQGRPN